MSKERERLEQAKADNEALLAMIHKDESTAQQKAGGEQKQEQIVNPTAPASDADKGSYPQESTQKNRNISANWVNAVASCVMAIFAFLAFFIAQHQLAEIQRQNRLDERAWISASTLSIHIDLPVTTPQQPLAKQPFIRLNFKNTGRTPALHIQTITSVSSTPDRITSPSNPPDKAQRESAAIAPGDGDGFWADAPIPKQFLDEVVTKNDFYFSATVWYDDIFGRSHWLMATYIIHKDLSAGFPSIGNDYDVEK